MNKIEIHSDFHILAGLDFDLLIGYPKKRKKTSNGSLDEEVGKTTFATFITHPENPMAKPNPNAPTLETMEKVFRH